MTIKEKADEYIGHPQEVDEGADVSLCRKAFIDGAQWMREKLLDRICEELGAFSKLGFLGFATYDVESFRKEMMKRL